MRTSQSPSKVCSACRNRLPLTQFHLATKGSQGVGSYCKECQRKRTKDWHQKRARNPVDPPTEGTKCCSTCKQQHPVSNYNRSKTSTDGLQSRCKGCVCQSSKAWRERHPEQVKKATAEYGKKHKNQLRTKDLKRRLGVSQEAYIRLAEASSRQVLGH